MGRSSDPAGASVKRGDFTWTEADFKACLKGPQATVNGNRTPFLQPQRSSDIDDIVAYLETLK